jgi:hypothetical protein
MLNHSLQLRDCFLGYYLIDLTLNLTLVRYNYDLNTRYV